MKWALKLLSLLVGGFSSRIGSGNKIIKWEVKYELKFLAVHTMPAPLTREEALVMARKVKDSCTVDAYWVKSWVQLNDEEKIVKIYCEWDAKTADDVRKLIEKLHFPLDGVYPMMADGLYPIMFDRSHPMPVAESKDIT